MGVRCAMCDVRCVRCDVVVASGGRERGCRAILVRVMRGGRAGGRVLGWAGSGLRWYGWMDCCVMAGRGGGGGWFPDGELGMGGVGGRATVVGVAGSAELDGRA